MWDVEYTHEFGDWWNSLSEIEQIDVAATVELLERFGPNLKFPHTSGIQGSKYNHIRELRIQQKGNPFRVLYAFDPSRCAILLVGGDKTGNDRWYDIYIPIADNLYEEHLKTLRQERLIND